MVELRKEEITGLLAGLAAVALHTFVDFNFYIVAILMVMGFMCARIQEISGHYFSGLIRDFIPAHKVSKKILMLVAAVFPFIILSYSLPIALGDYYWYKANEYFENSQIEKAELKRIEKETAGKISKTYCYVMANDMFNKLG